MNFSLWVWLDFLYNEYEGGLRVGLLVILELDGDEARSKLVHYFEKSTPTDFLASLAKFFFSVPWLGISCLLFPESLKPKTAAIVFLET